MRQRAYIEVILQVIPQYGSSKITVLARGKNTILKFLGNTK